MVDGFYKGKRICITGHTGFKGSWLSIWLNKLGADVTGFALEPPTNPSMFDICKISSLINSIHGDIRDRSSINRALMDSKPEIVFHLAAQPLVRESYKNPVETYEINVMGTVNLLESIRKCPSVRSVVIITSDKCYENTETFCGYKETDRLGGYDPYSNSKACQELVTDAFRNSFFNPRSYDIHQIAIATARAGNVIGGGDFAQDRLIPDIIRSIIEGRSLEIRNPCAIRPWQHVIEPLYGYLTLAERLYTCGIDYSGAWNFGPDENNFKTVEWILKYLYKFFKKDLLINSNSKCNPHETNCLKLDSNKARKLLNFVPKYDICSALDLTAVWIEAWINKQNLYEETVRQINNYESLIASF